MMTSDHGLVYIHTYTQLARLRLCTNVYPVALHPRLSCCLLFDRDSSCQLYGNSPQGQTLLYALTTHDHMYNNK